MAARWQRVVLVGAIVVATACGSSATTEANGTANTTSTVPVSAAGDVLTFREVLGTIPYGSTNASSVPAGSPRLGSARPTSCDGGRLVTPPARQTAAASIVLADAKKKSCYLLGPTLLTGRNVSAADAVYDSTASLWVVNVHFGTDDFAQKVGAVEVNKQVAIIVDGVVESAPIVNPGITGRDVQISGDFPNEAAARGIAALIDPSSRSRIPTTPTTTVIDIFAKRCSAVGPGLGFGPNAGTSEVTAEMARSALKRAHEAVPASLATLDDSEILALCQFTPTTTGVTPTTVCPNGDIAEAMSPLVAYAVDANLTATKLPGLQSLLPPGVTIPSGLCSLLPTP